MASRATRQHRICVNAIAPGLVETGGGARHAAGGLGVAPQRQRDPADHAPRHARGSRRHPALPLHAGKRLGHGAVHQRRRGLGDAVLSAGSGGTSNDGHRAEAPRRHDRRARRRLRSAFRSRRDRPAGRLRSRYRELKALMDQRARALRGLGVGPGDKVGILMPNCLEFAARLFGATAKLGAVAVPINGRFKAHELGHVDRPRRRAGAAHAPPGRRGDRTSRRCSWSVFAGLADQDPLALELARRRRLLRQIVDLGAARPGFLDARRSTAAAEQRRRGRACASCRRASRVRDDSAADVHVGHDRAARRAACSRHEALVGHGATVAETRFRLTAEDRFWDPLPMFHIGGIVPMLGACRGGAPTHATPATSTPTRRCAQLERERCTVAYPGVRDDLARRARTIRASPRPTSRAAHRPEHRRARAAGADAGARCPGAIAGLLASARPSARRT